MVNAPSNTRYTPAPSTIMLVMEVTRTGMVLINVFSRTNRYSCVLTLAWKPAQRPKTPFSAPLALMVSIMRMLEAVADESFAESLICTRVRLTRLEETMAETARLITMARMPIAVSDMLYLIMAMR